MVHALIQRKPSWTSRMMCLLAVPCRVEGFPERFGCGWAWSWPLCLLDTNSWDYFPWGYLKDCMYRTQFISCKRKEKLLQTRWEVTLRDTFDSFEVRLRRAHVVEVSHMEYVFTWRPHAHKLPMKFSFHSCIICFCTLEVMNIPYIETVACFSEYHVFTGSLNFCTYY